MLAHWKEREPVYAAREKRIIETLGYVPAYATSAQGGPVDVAPSEPRRAAARGITTPQDPSQGVSRAEFDDMVANLGIEEAEKREPAAAGRAAARPAGGRRARMRSGDGGDAAAAAPQGSGTGDDPGRGRAARSRKKPRNRKHGRPR